MGGWIEKITRYVKEVRAELQKVSWPSRKELNASTAIVIFVSLVLALFIFGVDNVLSMVLSLVVK